MVPGLVSLWKFNEPSTAVAAVSRLDSVGTNHLTDAGTSFVPSTHVGICLTSGAAWASGRKFEVASNASFNFGGPNTSFTWFGWDCPISTTQIKYLMSKRDTNQYQMRIELNNGSQRYRVVWSENGTTELNVVANTVAAPTTNAYHLIIAWFDAVAKTMNIQVDNGTVYSASSPNGVFAGTAPLRFGNRDGTSWSVSGYSDCCGICSGVLSANDRAYLWNNGWGRETNDVVMRRPTADSFVYVDGSSGVGDALGTGTEGYVNLFSDGAGFETRGLLRYNSVPIAKNAAIASAQLILKVNSTFDTAAPVYVSAVAQDNPGVIAYADFGAAKTTEVVSSNAPGSGAIFGINVKTIVEELINRAGWVSGNAMKFQIRLNPAAYNAGELMANFPYPWDDSGVLIVTLGSGEQVVVFVPRITII